MKDLVPVSVAYPTPATGAPFWTVPRRASPGDLTAWALVNRSWVAVQSDLGDAEAATEAVNACDKALALDPDYAFAHAVLAHASSLLVHQSEPDSEKLRAKARNSIGRALELAAIPNRVGKAMERVASDEAIGTGQFAQTDHLFGIAEPVIEIGFIGHSEDHVGMSLSVNLADSDEPLPPFFGHG